MTHYYYTDTFLEHLAEPRNTGTIENADGTGMARAGNTLCGDVVRMTLKIDGDVITDVKYKVYGCAVVIASCSVVSELATGKSIDSAMSIKPEEVICVFGEIPNRKLGCVRVAINALREALKNYEKNLNMSQ